MTTTKQPTALNGHPSKASNAAKSPSASQRGGTTALGTPTPNGDRPTGPPTSERRRRPRGIEVRVHGIGDHNTYSALGAPEYKELVDSRVWIGQLPEIPAHRLKLVNWSRANRQITRHLGWYLAFPFTLLNVAGYMEPTDKAVRVLMRAGIAIASLCMSLATAAWITVIFETAWRAFVLEDDRLTGVALQGIGPSMIIAFIVYRLIVGRTLVDRGGTVISLASIAVLVGLGFYLHKGPSAQRTTDAWPLHRYLAWGDYETVDAMTEIIVGTTGVVVIIAASLCVIALWKKRDVAAYAGAALLLVVAITLLHTAGSMLRLFTSTLVRFMPNTYDNWADRAGKQEGLIANVLLPLPDDLPTFTKVGTTSFSGPLRIDLMPVFFLVMVLIGTIVFWVQLWRKQRRQPESELQDPSLKHSSRTHSVVMSLPHELPPAVALAIVATTAAWVVLFWAFAHPAYGIVAVLLVALQIGGAVAIVMLIIRRPEKLSEQLRKTFGSIADIAGFWAPDLHPLAGASYRRALLSGIRQTVNDAAMEFPRHPIALVGHSQGSVICAWFMRGGHWIERPTEAVTDRQAIKDRMYHGAATESERIALFTCGSPLSTLYQTFFPRYFDGRFFSKTTEMTYRGSSWRNYWRRTDPIGSALPLEPESNNVDVTEKMDSQTLGHGEYWKEPKLRDDITTYFATAEVTERQSDPLLDACCWYRS